MSNTHDEMELAELTAKYDAIQATLANRSLSPDFRESLENVAEINYKPQINALTQKLDNPEYGKDDQEKKTKFAMEVANDRDEDLTREEAKTQHSYWMDFEFEKQEDVNRYVSFVLDNQDKFTDDEKREAAAKMQEAEDKGFELPEEAKAFEEQWKVQETEQQNIETQVASVGFSLGDGMDFDSGISPTDLPINNTPGNGRGTPS